MLSSQEAEHLKQCSVYMLMYYLTNANLITNKGASHVESDIRSCDDNSSIRAELAVFRQNIEFTFLKSMIQHIAFIIPFKHKIL